MTDRRKFISMTTTAALLAPVLAKAQDNGFLTGDNAQDFSFRQNELLEQMTDYLASQLENDIATAEIDAPHILDFALSWQPPEIKISQVERIVAYAFGYRPATTGSSFPDPGPTNAMLADTVYAVYKKNPVKVYAQWEIAKVLQSKYNIPNLISIEPTVNAKGGVTDLSIDAMAAAIVKMEGGDATAMGIVGVIGFRDNLKTCVLTSRGRGMNAYALDGVRMPGEYDPQSVPVSTRRRDLYLLNDMVGQLLVLRANAIAAAYPNG